RSVAPGANMLRCGLIGYGAWGAHHARVIAAHPRASLAAVAARSEASRTKAQQDHPSCRTFADYRDLLAQPDLDAVVIVLPSHLHFEVAQSALASGRHVLLEKPMCLSVEHCQELTRAAGAGNLVLAVGHEMRLSTLWGKAKELIASGALGDPLYA